MSRCDSSPRLPGARVYSCPRCTTFERVSPSVVRSERFVSDAHIMRTQSAKRFRVFTERGRGGFVGSTLVALSGECGIVETRPLAFRFHELQKALSN